MDEPKVINLAHSVLTARIIGCFYDVRRELGHGYSEAVYQRAMAIALRQAGAQAREGVPLPVHFRGLHIGTFEADLVVDDTILVEIKAAATLEGYAQAQLMNYLKAAGGGVGLLLNFGRRGEFKRIVLGDVENSLPRLNLVPPGAGSCAPTRTNTG